MSGTRLWWVALLDATVVAWMVITGSWLDEQSPALAVVTLGGRHELVTALAVVSFGILAVVAVTSDGFRSLSRLEAPAAAIAGILTIVAVAGLVALVAMTIAGGLFLGVMVRLLLH